MEKKINLIEAEERAFTYMRVTSLENSVLMLKDCIDGLRSVVEVCLKRIETLEKNVLDIKKERVEG